MSLVETLAPIWAELSSIKKRLPSVSPATVTSVGPIRIQIDGQGSPVAASPDSLVPVGPGDRVRVLRYGTTNLIIGVIGVAGRPWRTAQATVDLDFSNALGAATSHNWPHGRFTVPPLVHATIATVAGPNQVLVRVSSGTTTSVNVVGNVITGTPITGAVRVNLQAVQMTPTSAEG